MKVGALFQLLFWIASANAVVNLPNTLDRFHASYYQDIQLQVGPPSQKRSEVNIDALSQALAAANIVVKSDILEKVKRQTESLYMYVAVTGGLRVDISNNILLQSADHLTYKQTAGGVKFEVDLPVDMTSLIMYDLMKNYTWDSTGHCACSIIDWTAEMPIYSIPPIATLKESGVEITVNNEKVTTDLYDISYSMGFNKMGAKRQINFLEFKIQVYVNGEQTRRTVIACSLGGMFSFNTTTDFWDIAPLSDNALILPDTSCKNACPVNFTTIEAYPKCQKADAKCQCPTEALSFCNVDYAFSELIFPNETDYFVAETYKTIFATMEAVGPVSDDCANGLKDFLCKFYIPLCSENSPKQKPDLTLFTCGAAPNTTSLQRRDDKSQEQRQKATQNGAFSAYKTADGETETYPETSSSPTKGLQAWQIVLIVIGGVAFVALVVIIVVVVVIKRNGRRGQYKTIDH